MEQTANDGSLILQSLDTQHGILTMPQPAGEQGLMLIAGAVVLLYLWALISFRKNGGMFLLVLTAGLFSCGMEGWAEYMAMNYHPEIGGHIAYRAWGMPVPVHVALSYALYFGGPGYMMVRLIQRGKNVAAWWQIYAMFCVAVTLADLAALSSGVWTYYGHQPLVVFKFPLTYMFCNGAVIFAFSAVAHACLARLSGAEKLLTLFLAPLGLAMAWAGVCLPVGAALHSDSGPMQTTFAALVSIAVCLTMTHLCIKYYRSVEGVKVIPSVVNR